MVTEQAEDGAAHLTVTRAGCEALGRIVAARRARIEELFGQWTAEERDDLAALVERISRELVPEVRSVPDGAPMGSRSTTLGE